MNERKFCLYLETEEVNNFKICNLLAGREQLSIGQQPLQHLSSIDSAEDIKF